MQNVVKSSLNLPKSLWPIKNKIGPFFLNTVYVAYIIIVCHSCSNQNENASKLKQIMLFVKCKVP